MSERAVKYWLCDHCQRRCLRSVAEFSGWSEAADADGNTSHCCDYVACRAWMRAFCGENGYELPHGLRAAGEGL